MFKSLNLKELGLVMRLMEKKRWYFYITIMISALSVGAFSIINSFVYKDIMNSIVNSDINLLHNAIKLSVISLVLACIVSPIASYICAYISKETIFNLRMSLFDHVIRFPRKFFDTTHSGEILSNMTNDVSGIANIYDGGLYNVIFHFIVGVAATFTIIKLNWQLALIMIFFGILTTLINTTYAKPIGLISDKLQKYLGSGTQRFLDIVAGIRVIKLYNINDIIVDNFNRENDNIVKEGIKLTKKEAEKSSINVLLSSLTFLGVVGPGAFMVYYNTTDIGTVIAILTLKMQVFCLFEEVGGFFVNLQKSLAGAKRVFNLLDKPIEEDVSGIYLEEAVKNKKDIAITLNNIEYSYDESKKVINNINMTIDKNETTALVGFSGAGKSTIIKLLLGLYVPNKGKIILDGTSNKSINLKELRTKIAYVPQTPYLFNASIIENIGYGNSKATREDIIKAAKEANAHDFIMNMSKGYDTIIGEGGNGLSGGQKQRIVIARALIKNSSILLLDEATSALDSESEVLIKDSLKKVKNHKTIIIIAHRLSTIKEADKIYVLDKGQVIEEGKHETLIKNKENYKLLYGLEG